MKPAAAIVQPAHDIAKLAAAVDKAIRNWRDANKHCEEAEQRATTARDVLARMRLELGWSLAEARRAFPATGRNAGGWSRFLADRGLDRDVALDAMRYAGWVDENMPDRGPDDPLPTRKQAGLDLAKGRHSAGGSDNEDPVKVLGQERGGPPFRQMTEDDLAAAIARLDPEARKRLIGRANVKGGSGESARGTWCTSKDWAIAVGAWDLDPFSNPRSHILSAARCMLEDGGDAFGGGEPGEHPGFYLTGNGHGAQPMTGQADELTRVWIQPPYELVAAAIAHYGHTRFCALLRWSPDVKAWFPELWRRTAVVCHPFGERMEFEPPPGIDKSGDMPFPHALYYAHEADLTDEVRARCIVWRIDHDTDDVRAIPALRIVR